MVAYNLLVSALAFSARGHGFDPRSRREKISVADNAFLSVICRDDTRSGRRPSDRDVNWSSLCRESHPMCRLKNPTVAFILRNRCVQCTPVHYPREILWIETLTKGSLCKESHTLCRLKNPTVVYMITCKLSFCKTGVYNVRLLIIIERGCSSMYRKKERLDKDGMF